MNLSAALLDLGAAHDHLPEEALLWLRDNWDVAGPAASLVLARCSRDPENAADHDMIAAYFLLHLMAEKGEPAGAAMLARLAKTPEGLTALLGDAVNFTLTPMFISLFGGEPKVLQEIVETTSADPEVKGCALTALAYASASGMSDRAALEHWMTGLPVLWQDAQEDESCFDGFAHAIALLGAEDLAPLARAAFEGGLIHEELMEREEFEEIYALAREETNPLATFEREGLAPFTDAMTSLAAVEAAIQLAAQESPEDYDNGLPGEDENPVETVVNPNRDVGRNDPCPCGSGKKFKKCCLAA